MSQVSGDGARIVFVGDSVTDCGRRADPSGLGDGYVRRLAQRDELLHASIFNRGIGGNRTPDLLERWERDVLELEPTTVSLLVGINDVWRRYDRDDPTPIEDFRANYRALLTSLTDRNIEIVVMDPFLIPVFVEQSRWAEDLDPKISAIHALAEEFGAHLIPLHAMLNDIAISTGAHAIAADGVHPTSLGHDLIAAMWMRAMHRETLHTHQ